MAGYPPRTDTVYQVGDLVRASEAGRAYYSTEMRGAMTKGTVTRLDPPIRVRVEILEIDSGLPIRIIRINRPLPYQDTFAWGAVELLRPLVVPKFSSVEEADAWLEGNLQANTTS